MILKLTIAWRYIHANWKNTDKWSLTCFKSILKNSHSNYLETCSNLPVTFTFFLKSSLLLNSFYCLFRWQTKLCDSITKKLEKLWMRKFQCLLFELKRSYTCCYIICMTVSWMKHKAERKFPDNLWQQFWGFLA